MLPNMSDDDFLECESNAESVGSSLRCESEAGVMSGDGNDAELCDCSDGEEDVCLLCDCSDGEEDGCLSGVAILTSSDSDAEDRVGYHAPSQWRVGEDCGVLLRRGGRSNDSHINPQSRVLLTNLFVNLRTLPRGLARSILDHLRPNLPKCGQVVDRVIAALCCVGVTLARDTYNKLRRAHFDPSLSSNPEVDCGASSGDDASLRLEASDASNDAPLCFRAPDASHRLMMLHVREVLANAVLGRADVDYVRALSRYRLAGVQIGNKYCSRHFAVAVEHLACVGVRAITRDRLAGILPGLGIPSDLVVIFDGISIGSSSFSTHESLLATGVVATSPTTGGFQPHLLGAPSQGSSHRGRPIAGTVFTVLEDNPWAFDKATLRARVALFGGDGAVVLGGEERRGSSTGAAEIAWETCHPDSELNATDWDLFHRVEAAGSRAIKQSSMAQEVQAVSRVITSLFGVGLGRVLLRGAALQAGTTAHRSADGGGTRKAIHVDRVAKNIINNYQAYHAALQARLALVHGGDRSTSQTVKGLVAVGRRLTTTDFVTFVLIFHDVQVKRIKPFVLASETLAQEPVQTARITQDLLTQLHGPDRVHLRRLRVWAAVAVLLPNYVHERDIWSCWVAFRYTSWGQAYPTFMRYGHEILYRQQFKKCELIWQYGDKAVNPAQTMLLSPRCQCPSRRLRPRGRIIDHYTEVGHVIRRRLPGITRDVRVPEWVATSEYDARTMLKEREQFFKLRFMTVPRVRPVRRELQGVSMYKRHWNACEAPHAAQHTHLAVDGALVSALSYIGVLHDEIRDYCQGAVGSNESMRRLIAAARTCWDWEHLRLHRPTVDHIKAFEVVWLLLKPCLSHTLWPSAESHPLVQHSWPALDDLKYQYTLLCARVRAATGLGGRCHRAVHIPHHCQVVCLRSHGILMPLFQRFFRSLWKRQMRSRSERSQEPVELCVATILHFAGQRLSDTPCDQHDLFQETLPSGGPKSFQVSLHDLVRVGYGRRFCGMRGPTKASLPLRDEVETGAIASLAGSVLRGRWVKVLAVERNFDIRAMAARLDLDAQFCRRRDPHGHCWHAVRIHHRCRHLRGIETVCEKWGSLLHTLYNDVAGLGPARMAVRLFLRESGLRCQGSQTDEHFVAELARVITEVQGRSASSSRGSDIPYAVKRLATSDGGMEPCALDLDGEAGARLDMTGLPMAWKQQHAPTDLPAAAAQAVQQGVKRDGRRNIIVRSQLPLFAEDARAIQKTRATSVLRARLKEFLESETGKQWWGTREELMAEASDDEFEDGV